MFVIYEARLPNIDQVMCAWRSFGGGYDARRIAELELQGFVIRSIELRN